MSYCENFRLLLILATLFALSVELSSQTTNQKIEVRVVSKFKYILPKKPFNELDSTRRLNPEELDLIEFFDKDENKVKTEKYKNGKLISTRLFNENIDTSGSIETNDTLEMKKEYDPKSMYGAVMKSLEEMGLENSRSKEKYEAKYNANGSLIAEYITDLKGDTIRSFKHIYDDTNDLIRTEGYEDGELNSTRIFMGGGGNERWGRIILFDKTGEISSDDWTRFYTVSALVSRSESIFKWGKEEGSQSESNAIFFKDEKGETIKAIFEVNDELLVIEYHYGMTTNP